MRTATLALVLLAALALTATAHAGEPAGVPEPTASISGRVFYEGRPDLPYTDMIVVVSAVISQPVPVDQARMVYPDDEGNFAVSGLAAGEYLVGIRMIFDMVPSLGEKILLDIGGTTQLSLPALRVRLSAGQAMTGIEIAIQPPPTPIPLPPPGSPGTISGRVVVEGRTDAGLGQTFYNLCVVPAEASQPLDPFESRQSCTFSTETTGEFIVYELAAGDYLIALVDRDVEVVTPMPERLSIESSQGEIRTLPALRVTLPEGRGLTGVEIVIKPLAPILAMDDFPQLSPVAVPATGTGPGSLDRVTGYIGLAVAALAALLLAGGVALRLWGDRRA